MPFEIDLKRQAVIDALGHVLVLGGPGAGKTTLALLKAKSLLASLKPGQKALFLSFSRAAVQQILTRCREVLTRNERMLIDVRTYHAFCWDLLQSHGCALRGVPLTMMTPGDEGRARTRFDGEWDFERRRLLDSESRVCFDLFAHATARLVEESQHLRKGIADLYPLIILDEFQDTDDDQWRLTKALAGATTAVFLADADQRIYDFRPGVRPERIELLRGELNPAETDLETDNYRSRGSQIIAFANAVLRGEGPMPHDGLVGGDAAINGHLFGQMTVQLDGAALTMPKAKFVDAYLRHPHLRNLVDRYQSILLVQAQQNGACHALHSVRSRLCRWLLQSQDMIGSDTFSLTQEFLSHMLGVRRNTVSVEAHAVQEAGLIRYSRGNITILNRDGLEDCACECYSVIREETDKLMGPAKTQSESRA